MGRINNLLEDYYFLEKLIMECIAKLECYGEQCECEDRWVFNYINDDSDEAFQYCLNCGGYV
ncbi:hypothetical protein, partial [Mycobacterium tuberculosis]|uniref:hypothetical protein n=1 Tax=Mycobacterium tuberculosis TaxID=1773 RepID=UPI001C0054AA